MYGTRREKPGLLTKTLGKLIAILIMWAVVNFFEYVLNPYGHVSVYVHRGEVAQVENIVCNGDPVPWMFTIEDTWSRSKKYYATILRWQRHGETNSAFAQMEIRSDTSLDLPGCNDQQVGVAHIWSMNTEDDSIHLRVNPDYPITLVNAPIPQEGLNNDR